MFSWEYYDILITPILKKIWEWLLHCQWFTKQLEFGLEITCFLTYVSPMFNFYTPWKHPKKFSDVFSGCRHSTIMINSKFCFYVTKFEVTLIANAVPVINYWTVLNCTGSTLPPKITNNSMTISGIPWCGSADVSSIAYYFKYILLYNISNTSSLFFILFFRALSLLDTSITIFVNLFYSQRLNLIFYWHSNSFMHNAEKWSCNI